MKCSLCEKGSLDLIYHRILPCPEGLTLNVHETLFPLDVYLCDQCKALFYDSKYMQALKNEKDFYKDSYGIDTIMFSTNKNLLQEDLFLIEDKLHNVETVLEIGGFDLSFIEGLKSKKKFSKVVLIDPCFEKDENKDGMFLIKDYFPSPKVHDTFDLVIMRNVIELVEEPKDTLEKVYRMLNENGLFFLEVPNPLESTNKHIFYFSTERIWDFNNELLKYFLLNCGFSIAAFQGNDYFKYICVKGKDKFNSEPSYLDIDVFKDIKNYHNWEDNIINSLKEKNKKVILWGAGRTVSSIVYTFQKNGICVAHVVDIDNRKHGLFVSGSDLKVESPNILNNLKDKDNYLIFTNSYAYTSIQKDAESRGFNNFFSPIYF